MKFRLKESHHVHGVEWLKHFITDPVPVRSILTYLDLASRPPPLSPARAPPQSELAFDQSSGFDPADAEPIPTTLRAVPFDFDQSLPD